MLNIIIIDLRPILRMGLKYLFEKNYKTIIIKDFGTIYESDLTEDSSKPDVIFLGLDDNMDKVRTLKKVKKNYPESKLIIYDPDAKAETVLKYLKSGVHGYLSKKSDLTKIRTCIEAVVSGQFYVDPLDMNTLLAGLLQDPGAFKKIARNKDFPLTPRQNEIAKLYAKGMSTSDIALKLGLRPTTISTVKTRIYEKLNVDNIIDLKNIVTK